MTRDEILAMEAGRELDALVAEKVMERTLMDGLGGTAIRVVYYGKDTPHPLPYYSTNIAAAWEVVAKIKPDIDGGIAVEWLIDGGDDRAWHTEIWTRGEKYRQYCSFAPTAPLAICRAALLATQEQEAQP